MIRNKCNLCGCDEAFRLHTITRFSKPFHIVECARCRLLYQYPQPKNLEAFYDKDYYSGENEYSYIDEREDKFLRDIENERRINNLKKVHGKTPVSLLDVGCSFGMLVKKAKELGLDAYGTDISEYPKKNGITEEIYTGDICDEDACDVLGNVFDIITMIEVIEHLSDPMQALMNCRKILKDDGLILIQTTNMDSVVRKFEGIESRYYLPGHLFYFSLETLTKLLNAVGLDVEKVYFGHETGLIPAIIRKSIANMGRYDLPDFLVLLYTMFLHTCSKIRIGKLAMHNGMVVIARKRR